jgi:hypothetical protein
MKSRWKRARRIAATALFLTFPATSVAMMVAIGAGIARDRDELSKRQPASRPAVQLEAVVAAVVR